MAHHNHDCCKGHFSVDPSGDLGIQYSLYNKIDLDKVECLNEDVEGSGKSIFKPWEDRLDKEKVRSFFNYNIFILYFYNH